MEAAEVVTRPDPTVTPTRPCTCAGGGTCGFCYLWRTSDFHRRLWSGEPPTVTITARVEPDSMTRPLEPVGGPGTELKRLLEGYGVKASASCGCHAYAAKMDRWGAAGCREKRTEIVKYFGQKVRGADWRAKLTAVTRAVSDALTGGFVPDPRDVAGSLVDEAIRRADAEVVKRQRVAESDKPEPAPTEPLDAGAEVPASPPPT